MTSSVGLEELDVPPSTDRSFDLTELSLCALYFPEPPGLPVSYGQVCWSSKADFACQIWPGLPLQHYQVFLSTTARASSTGPVWLDLLGQCDQVCLLSKAGPIDLVRLTSTAGSAGLVWLSVHPDQTEHPV